jgi:subtilase family serine protease
MTYTNGTAISAYDYNLGILYSLNDSRGGEITSRPDLIVSDIIFPVTQVAVNQTIEIKLIIKNVGGNLTSENGLRNIVFTGNNWTTTNVSHPDYPIVAKPLQNGQTFEITYTGKFIASGANNFTAKVDEPSEVVESNEKNNIYSESITVATN